MDKTNYQQAKRISQSIFGSERNEETHPSGEKRWLIKAGIIAAVILGVSIVLVLKAHKSKPASFPSAAGEVSFKGSTVLATVNGKPITLMELQAVLEGLPAEYRAEYERQKDVLLEELIARTLLTQEANRLKISESEAYRQALQEHEAHPGHEEHVLIDTLLRREVLDKVRVSEEDLRKLYEESKHQLPANMSLEQAKELLIPSVRQQKEYEALEAYIAQLRDRAKISYNEEWKEAQKRVAADNPLDNALKSGKPVLADFGRGTCIPCKMMKPILDKLAEEFKGRVHVLILDTGEYAHLARRHRIRVIPTQIFFSAEGKELFRHEGFMSREDILAKMNELRMTPD